MGANSKIEWTDATVNVWWGCTEVGPGCDHCYARELAERFGKKLWGKGAPREWKKNALNLLTTLNGQHEKFHSEHGRHRAVFLHSMSDLFDNEVPDDWRDQAFTAIEACENLDVIPLTKRETNVERMIPTKWRVFWPKHVGLMVTMVNQEEADRIGPRLLKLKAKFHIPWIGVSIEPMLGPIDLRRTGLLGCDCPDDDRCFGSCNYYQATDGKCNAIDWVVLGGESGKNARPMHPLWARSVRDQCKESGVPFLFKQWGTWAAHKVLPGGDLGRDIRSGKVRVVHPSGLSADELFEAQGLMTEPGSMYMAKLGKDKTGRLLDGRTWDGYPRAFRRPYVGAQ